MDQLKREILMNKEVIAVNQDPLGVAGGRIAFWDCSYENACQIWYEMSDHLFILS